ncbi:MAG: hypothetical protein DMG15_08155, partial [Acidobacteria bacterium]
DANTTRLGQHLKTMPHGFQGNLVLKTSPTPTFVQSFQCPPNLLGVILDSSEYTACVCFWLMTSSTRLKCSERPWSSSAVQR